MSTFLRLASLITLSLAFTACLADDEGETDQPIGGDDDVVCIEIAVECPVGERVADTNGDGCALECEPVVCPAYVPDCGPDEVPMDLDGDGCALECGVFCGNNL